MIWIVSIDSGCSCWIFSLTAGHPALGDIFGLYNLSRLKPTSTTAEWRSSHDSYDGDHRRQGIWSSRPLRHSKLTSVSKEVTAKIQIWCIDCIYVHTYMYIYLRSHSNIFWDGSWFMGMFVRGVSVLHRFSILTLINVNEAFQFVVHRFPWAAQHQHTNMRCRVPAAKSCWAFCRRQVGLFFFLVFPNCTEVSRKFWVSNEDLRALKGTTLADVVSVSVSWWCRVQVAVLKIRGQEVDI